MKGVEQKEYGEKQIHLPWKLLYLVPANIKSQKLLTMSIMHRSSAIIETTLFPINMRTRTELKDSLDLRLSQLQLEDFQLKLAADL